LSDINLVCKDTILVSYPKSGRTWLRMMLAKILKDTGVDTDKNEMILCTHKNYNDVVRDYGKDKKIIFLIRDPGDVVVSQFRELEANTALNGPNGDTPTISRFLRGVYVKPTSASTGGMPIMKDGTRRAGIIATIQYMNEWFTSLRDVKEYKIITYEEMKKDAFSVLKEVVEFIGYDCDDKHIEASVEYSSFSNMKKIEEELVKNSRLVGPHHSNLLRKYKGNFGKSQKVTRVRKGKVGSYREELHGVDISYIKAAKTRYLHLPLAIKIRGINY